VSTFIPPGLGWIPDLPDPRDYTCRHEHVRKLLEKLPFPAGDDLPDEVDLRIGDEEGEYFFTDAEDQGPLNSSTAFAVLGLLEYWERRVHGRVFKGSKRFLYKVTRNYRQRFTHSAGDSYGPHSHGDIGADLRTTLKVLTKIGVPPEEFWPYDVDRFDDAPSPFAYSLAKPRTDLIYFRLDAPNQDGEATWQSIRTFLAAGLPIAFGFSVPTSLTLGPEIPYRPALDSYRGGQAALAIGYRLHHFARGQHALLIRPSWGSQWGDNGNGWLRVAVVKNRLARDLWVAHNLEITGA